MVVNIAILLTLCILVFGPSGIVGSRIVEFYTSWQTRQAIVDQWPTLTDVDSRLRGHGVQPSRTIVEFIDYECPFCRQVSSEIAQSVAAGEVDVVIRHFPMASIHPRAREGALAAVCSERHGVFERLHEALLTEDEWLTDRNWSWPQWVARLGVQDTASFRRCMAAQETDLRIQRDIELAESLGVTGTPAFVSPHGLFAGSDGFVSALAELPRAEQSVGQAIRRRGGRVLFDSRSHPDMDVSVLESVETALFVGNSAVAVVDGRVPKLIELQTGEVQMVGGIGDGPGEFSGRPLAVARWSEGLVVWDRGKGRVSLISDDGELIDSRLQSNVVTASIDAKLVGTLGKDTVVFWVPPSSTTLPDGVTRPNGQVMAFSAAGPGRKITDVLQREIEVAREGRIFRRTEVLFGAASYVAITGEHFVVADTDADDVVVLDGMGELVASFPWPGERIGVSSEQLSAVVDSIDVLLRGFEEAVAGQQIRPRGYQHRSVAGPIDAMMTDRTGRVWMRRYLMPEDLGQLWWAWEHDRQAVELQLVDNETLLDADEDRILVRVEDALGVQALLVREMVASSF